MHHHHRHPHHNDHYHPWNVGPTPRARASGPLHEKIATDAAVDISRYLPTVSGITRSQLSAATRPPLTPTATASSDNPLRPRQLADVIGQERLKPLLARLIASARARRQPLDHLLFVGGAGTGKTTLATVIANEIGSRVFQLKAPLDMATLEQLREAARERDVIFIDEIHQQVSGDRRGVTQSCDPESFYHLLEDGVLMTSSGPLPFPRVTWIGATTDVGLLPQPLSDRFTIQPRLSLYTEGDMATIARRNCQALALTCDPGVCELVAAASRGIPRVVNNYMKSAKQLSNGHVSIELMYEVIVDLNSTTLDGLTDSMQTVLTFLYRHCRRESTKGVLYQASVATLATACGHGRDTKAIALLVEPYLLQRGFLEVRPQGRTLTPAGVTRARQLIGGR